MNDMSTLLQILSVLGLFFIDICGIMLFKQLLVQSVLCFYIARLFHQPVLLPLIVAALCIHVEWFILYDSLSLAGLFLLPITALVFYLKRLLVPSIAYPPLTLLLCMGLQAWLIHLLTAQNLPLNAYTILSVIANIILLLSNSLI